MAEVGNSEADKPKTEDFIAQVSKENFGHGDVEVVKIIPKGITEDGMKSARKQIFIPGNNPSGHSELEKLLADLLILAQADKDSGMIVMGVAFTGARSNSAQLVQGLPQGVEATQLQHDKAQDIASALSESIESNNAEIVAFSSGGPVAQLALMLGLNADTVGLFNSSGLHSEKPAHIRGPSKKTVEPKSQGEQTLIDRAKRSRIEYYSAYFARTGPLISRFPQTQFLVANSEGDRIYSKGKSRSTVGKHEVGNVKFVDLEWKGHVLSNDPSRRGEKLGAIAKIMRDARPTPPSAQ